jgi:hypothetical protein
MRMHGEYKLLTLENFKYWVSSNFTNEVSHHHHQKQKQPKIKFVCELSCENLCKFTLQQCNINCKDWKVFFSRINEVELAFERFFIPVYFSRSYLLNFQHIHTHRMNFISLMRNFFLLLHAAMLTVKLSGYIFKSPSCCCWFYWAFQGY